MLVRSAHPLPLHLYELEASKVRKSHLYYSLLCIAFVFAFSTLSGELIT